MNKVLLASLINFNIFFFLTVRMKVYFGICWYHFGAPHVSASSEEMSLDGYYIQLCNNGPCRCECPSDPIVGPGLIFYILSQEIVLVFTWRSFWFYVQDVVNEVSLHLLQQFTLVLSGP
jgi:hypothetical protein